MPLRRYYKKKRPSRRFRRKKYSRKGRMNKNVYYFRRDCNTLYDIVYNQTFSSVSSLGSGMDSVYNFALRFQDIPAYTDFTELYDEYRIKACKFSFIPVANISGWTGNTGGGFNVPTYSVRSYSAADQIADANTPTTVSGIREYQNCKWKPYNRIHSRYVKVKANLGSIGGGVPLYRTNDWMSTTSTDVLYSGCIFGVEANAVATGTVLYQIECKVYMQFRNAR